MSLDAQTTQTETAPAQQESAPPTRDTLVGLFAAELDAEDNPPAPAQKQEAAPVEAAAEPATGEQPVEAAEGTEPDSETVEAQPPATPAINAPSGMSEEDRQRFAQLSPEVQAWVTQREQQRTADYTRKTQEVAEQAKAAKAEREALSAQLQHYNAFLSKITEQRIEPPNPAMQATDPDGYAHQLGLYVNAKHQQEIARQEQARVTAEQQQIEEKAYNEFVRTEASKLYEIMPEFRDPKQGPALKKAVVEYAEANGFAKVLPKATAQEVSILVKAMRYDAAQKAAKAAPVVQAPAPKSTRPSPAQGARRTSGFASAVQNVIQTGSRDALAAAYLAQLQSER